MRGFIFIFCSLGAERPLPTAKTMLLSHNKELGHHLHCPCTVPKAQMQVVERDSHWSQLIPGML